jgi:hypothetical protein
MTGKLVPRSITFTIPGTGGGPSVTVQAVEDGSGDIVFTDTADNTGNQHSTLGGLFFDVNNVALTSSNLKITGPSVTYTQVGKGNVSNLAPGAPGINMQGVGSFDVGVAFGDVSSTTFTLSDTAHDLTLDDLAFEEFGARPKAQSEKITAIAPAAPKATGDSVTTLEDTSITIPVSALATDANPGATLKITEVTQPLYGSVTISADGQSLIYNPDPGGGVAPLDYEVNGQLTGDQVTFQYAIADSLGGTDSSSVTVTETPVADPPTVTDKVLAAHSGDPVTETRIQVTATSPDFGTAEQGSDYIQSVLLSGVPSGVTLTGTGLIHNADGTYTFNGSPSDQGSLSFEVDVNAPAGGANFNLVTTATNAETEGAGSPATATGSTSLNIDVTNSTFTASPDFNATNQSIWSTGNAFLFDWNQFLGIGPNASFGGSIGGITTTPVFGAKFGASLGGSVTLTAGFQADLHIDGGSFNADLPFNISLDDTYNHTTDTLEIDPTATPLAGGDLTTTGPGGSFSLDAIFNAMAQLHGAVALFGSTSFHTTVGPIGGTTNLVSFTSGQLHVSFSVGPVTVSLAWPQVNTSGTGGPVTISTSGTSGTALGLSVDVVAVILDAIFGDDPLKGSFGPINYDLLSGNIGVGAALGQQFNLNDLGLTPTLLVGTSNTPEALSFGTPLVIDNASSLGLSGGALPISLSLTPDATLQNITSIVPEVTASLTVGQISVPHVTSGSLFSASTTIPIANVPVYNNTFGVNFNSQTLNTSIA